MRITTDGGRLGASLKLLNLQEAGGFTLPADLIAAGETYTAAQALTVTPPAAGRSLESGAAALVQALSSGKTPDPLSLAAEVRLSEQQAADYNTARRMVHAAVTEAGSALADLTITGAEAIITERLAPAYAEILTEAAKVAATLGGTPIEGDGWDAPAKVRTARTALAALAGRRAALYSARQACLGLCGSEPRYDTTAQFSVFKQPQALAPGYVVGGTARLPMPDLPTEPTAQLLWLVGPGAPAQPWLPTYAQQDEAYLALFGAYLTERTGTLHTAGATA